MKPSEALLRLEPAKAGFCGALIQALSAVDGIRSVTFTGTFVESTGLAGISDIDVVVVVDKLTREKFAASRAAAASVNPALLGLSNHHVQLNDTFGPLKFDEPGVIVIHLMVYDLAGHREHALQSPFTCLDWERSPHYAGISLRRLYPVIGLTPRHFFAARRSLGNYLQDISSGIISYRRHDFETGEHREIVERLVLDRRHQGEYAYHIVRNLVANYAKLVLRVNRRLSQDELLDFWRTALPGCGDLIGWFSELSAVKQARRHDFPPQTLEYTRDFLERFSGEISQAWTNQSVRHVFVRHARTALNDGRFLGQRRDPGISASPARLDQAPGVVFASPALRCQETAAALARDLPIRTDSRLHEIDYGLAEGMDYTELSRFWPALPAAWGRGEDPPFPEGENTAMVATRLQRFLGDLPAIPSLVVTHNVVLRCLVGSCLKLPVSCWHRIPVEHLDAFTVLQLDGIYHLDLSAAQNERISDALAGHIA